MVDVRLISPCLSFLVPVGRIRAATDNRCAVLRSVALYRLFFFVCTLQHPISSISLFSLIFRWIHSAYLGCSPYLSISRRQLCLIQESRPKFSLRGIHSGPARGITQLMDFKRSGPHGGVIIGLEKRKPSLLQNMLGNQTLKRQGPGGAWRTIQE